jgi:hypothetical protein
MQSLPEGSKVICMGGTVRLVTQRESLPVKRSGFNPESKSLATVCFPAEILSVLRVVEMKQLD